MSETARFAIAWIDHGRAPRETPDPAYPQGIDLDASGGAARRCHVTLPYPARRCGRYTLSCKICGKWAVCTTAGRPDDPRSITLPCNTPGGRSAAADANAVRPD